MFKVGDSVVRKWEHQKDWLWEGYCTRRSLPTCRVQIIKEISDTSLYLEGAAMWWRIDKFELAILERPPLSSYL